MKINKSNLINMSGLSAMVYKKIEGFEIGDIVMYRVISLFSDMVEIRAIEKADMRIII